MARWLFPGTGRDVAWWPLLLLLATVLVPTGGGAWMMRQALENERLAARQRLADAYRLQLAAAQSRLAEAWARRFARIDEAVGAQPPAAAFSACARERLADAVIVCDSAGRVAYPDEAAAPAESARSPLPAWRAAQQLEFADRDLAAAAAAYAAIAESDGDRTVAARARQAQARCLARAGDREGAIAALKEIASSDFDAVDGQGRPIAADATLRIVELLDPDAADRHATAARLAERLDDYDAANLASNQRRFLMNRLAELAPAEAELPTRDAENLAANFLARAEGAAATDEFAPVIDGATWAARTPSRRAVVLCRTETLRSVAQGALDDLPLPSGVSLAFLSPGAATNLADELVALPADERLPGWRLAIVSEDADLLEHAAAGRVARIAAAAVLIGAVTFVLAAFAAATLGKRMRLARLKNDLVATVSHELKTPLASIRLLVDTLLEEADRPPTDADAARTRDYLGLIARENERLTRLIDNFLTFSRLERGKQRFQSQTVKLADVARQAVAAVGDRFASPDAQLRTELDESLAVRGDLAALATVVVNLLDNAWKYTGPQKQVALTARREGDDALLVVADNGIGMSPKAAGRVFDQFYQVDDRVARTREGCGLGLSIVRAIVDAHGGEVRVESRPDHGSTFLVKLPALADAPPTAQD